MNILIIGCGYVGTRIAQRWQSNGHHVTVTTRKKERIEELKKTASDVALLENNNLPSIMEGKDLILVAVAPDQGGSYSQTYLETAQAIAKGPLPKQLIVISSTSVYGEQQGKWVTEDSPLNPTNENQQILIDTEKTYLALKNKSICIFRLGEITGPERDPLDRLKQLNGKTLPGTGENYTNLSPIKLIIDALYKAQQLNLSGIFNLVSGLHIPRKDYYQRLSEEHALPPPTWDPSKQSTHGGNKRVDASKYFRSIAASSPTSQVVKHAFFFLRSIFQEPASALLMIPYELFRFWKPVSHIDAHPCKEDEVPVHFLHGYLAFASLWRFVEEQFLKNGIHYLTAKTRYSLDSIERQADREWIYIKKILEKTEKKQIDLVAHSEGGLVALTLARKHPEHIRKVVCIGSPVRGTDHANTSHRLLSYIGLDGCAEEMSSTSTFIRNLNHWLDNEAKNSPTRFLFIYSSIDQIILPPEHSLPRFKQPNFTFHKIDHLLHIQMHFDPDITESIIHWLKEQQPSIYS